MTIDNQGSKDNPLNATLASQAETHSQAALEQSALYAAQLAIARWISSSGTAAVSAHAPGPCMAQAAWYAQAQQNFQEWLARGGFAQYDVLAATGCLTFVRDGEVTVEPLAGAHGYVGDAQKIEE
ncbi:MAG: hypothetical protein JWQ01_4054 [Massilia sp.]|jgi:hypothetical protein|nr:hypothetical protein [Massilia sp.]